MVESKEIGRFKLMSRGLLAYRSAGGEGGGRERGVIYGLGLWIVGCRGQLVREEQGGKRRPNQSQLSRLNKPRTSPRKISTSRPNHLHPSPPTTASLYSSGLYPRLYPPVSDPFAARGGEYGVCDLGARSRGPRPDFGGFSATGLTLDWSKKLADGCCNG